MTPRSAKEPSIGRVILLNRGKQNVNKATFNESLSAQARTANLVGKEITFYLWEEGASEDEKYKKPKKARVDKNGIAEVKFSLIEYASQPLLMQIFNFNSKTTKKFFVTAVYDSKKSTNKGAVEASEAKKEASEGILSKGSEVLGEGWNNIVDAVEKALTATSVGKTDLQKKNSTCICKEQYKDLIWGGKVNCEFRKKIISISQKLGLPQQNYEGANWLMAVMALETGRSFDPTVGTFKSNPGDNRNGGYVGLIQFGKGASIDLGVKRSELLKMSAETQLDYVEKHFLQKRFRGKLKTKTDLYLAVNYPNACGHGTEKNYVVYESSKAAYDDNPMFKKEADEFYIDKKGKKRFYEGKEGKSYIWEFEEAINDFYNEGKSNKISTYTCQNVQASKLSAKDLITYHIYSDGTIEKHIP